MFKLTFKHLMNNKKIFVISVILFSILIVVFCSLLNYFLGVNYSMNNLIDNSKTLYRNAIMVKGFDYIDLEKIKGLEKVEEIYCYENTFMPSKTTTLFKGDEKYEASGGFEITKVKDEIFPKVFETEFKIKHQDGEIFLLGRAPENLNEVAVNEDFFKMFAIENYEDFLNAEISIYQQVADNEENGIAEDKKIVGVINSELQDIYYYGGTRVPQIYMTIDNKMPIEERFPYLMVPFVDVYSPSYSESIKVGSELRELFDDENAGLVEISKSTELELLDKQKEIIVILFLTLGIITALLVMVNVLYVCYNMLKNKTGEFGILLSSGSDYKQVFKMMLIMFLIIFMFSVIIGLIITAVVTFLLLNMSVKMTGISVNGAILSMVLADLGVCVVVYGIMILISLIAVGIYKKKNISALAEEEN